MTEQKQVRIGIVGPLGRMGRALVACTLEDPQTQLTGLLQRTNHFTAGEKANPYFPDLKYELTFKTDLQKMLPQVDAIIDFSSPEALRTFAPVFAEHGKCAWVIGTTGLTVDDYTVLQKTAESAPVLQSGNMSLGVNLLTALVQQTAQRLGDDFDIEVLEMHHHHKVDAPSGTALMLGQAAAQGRGVVLDDVKETVRDGITSARKKGNIGFATLRGGTVVGEHSVIFAGDNERLVLNHIATDRRIFAKGAVHAAKWLSQQEKGFYSMKDVLKI